MRSDGVRVEKSRAEATRLWLRERGFLRSDVRPAHSDEDIVFPIGTRPPDLPPGAAFVEFEFENAPSAVPSSYRELLALPDDEAGLLPRAFDVVGDVVLIRIPPELEARAREIGQALLKFVPGARLVGWDHGVHGTERIRQLDPIAGEGSFRTRHRENGLAIDVDLSVAYFSPRLGREHARVAGAVRPGERFADLCCGVGPFTLHVVRDARAASVVAVDVNPGAVALLRSNLKRIRSPTPVEVVEGLLESFLPTAGVSDRVVLNLPHEGIKYVSSVGARVASGGTLHYFEVTPRAAMGVRGSELASLMEPNGEWTVVEQHPVHPYSPESDVVAWTLHRNGAT